MPEKSVVERLWEVNPNSEIWWDSSPLIYDGWRSKMMDKAGDKEEMKAWLDRFFNENNKPEENLFRGVTTNPPLSHKAIKANPDYWAQWIENQVKMEKDKAAETVFWDTYREIVKRGAQVYMPLFEASQFKRGFISGQVDPRARHDVDKMVSQAVDLHSISPNVMIKVPGTAEGYEAIRQMTAKGIPTNNTLSFIIPQFVACMKAVTEGMEEAKALGVDLSKWRSVITAMSTRFGLLGDMQKEAREKGIELTEEDERWAEIAVFKKACRLVDENEEYPGKMLICSIRMSPEENGVVRSWHLEKIAGADIIYTCPPDFLEALLFEGRHLQFTHQINDPVPQEVMDKLMKIPYFERGYREDGYTVEEFNSHPALLATAEQHHDVTQEMVAFVTHCISEGNLGKIKRRAQ
jgi:transaldolase